MSTEFYVSLAALVTLLLAGLSLLIVSVDYNQRGFHCAVLDDSERLISANVHYLDWWTLTFEAYDIEMVRAIPPITVASPARLDCLSSAIATDRMNLSYGSAAPRDGRFLLVGTTRSGDQLEVYADRFSICSLDEEKCRKNDDLTRVRISFILEAHAL